MPPIPSAAEAAAELLRRRRARASLLDFTTYTKPDYSTNWHHQVLAETLDRWASPDSDWPDNTIFVVNMPPQHGKTELVSRRLAAKIFGDNPDARIGGCSYTADLAGSICRDVQRIMGSPEYKRLYPHLELGGTHPDGTAAKKDSSVFEIRGRRGVYRSSGVGGGISGHGFDYLIADDLIKGRNEAESVAERDAVWRWFWGDFITRRHGKTRILLCMTRWHEDDPVGRLEQLAGEGGYRLHVLRFPAISEGPLPGDPRQPGEALWPARHPLAQLEIYRASSPYDWASVYQQRPRNPAMQEWPDEFFGPHIWFDDWPGDLILRIMGLDPSKGKADASGDMSAWICLGVDRAWTLWVDADLDNTRPVEPLRGQDLAHTIIGDGIRLVRDFKPSAVVIETNGFQEFVARSFLRWCLAQGITIPVFGINNKEPKDSRIRCLGPYFSSRRFRCRKTKGGQMLVDQLRGFSTHRYKDGPDALKLTEQLGNHLLCGGDDGVQALVA